jgi:hypothetical protein
VERVLGEIFLKQEGMEAWRVGFCSGHNAEEPYMPGIGHIPVLA